jgi:hypothetical protein
MLQKTSDIIANCYRHARDCADKAKQATIVSDQTFFRELERRWLFLAHNCELTDSLVTLSGQVRRHADGPK